MRLNQMVLTQLGKTKTFGWMLRAYISPGALDDSLAFLSKTGTVLDNFLTTEF
jgi:hypothetical protein